MNHRHTAFMAACLALYAAQGSAAETADNSNSMAEPSDKAVTRLKTLEVEAGYLSDYKADFAASPKFTAPLLDTPKSVSVITDDLMEQQAVTTLQQALRLEPGITFQAGEGGAPIADMPVIRGFNSAANIFVDGVRDIGSQTRDIFDVAAVEVIKGTDSVYHGRGSGGGSINLVSKKAQSYDFTRGSFTVGSSEKFRVTVDQNWAVGDSSGLRINALYETSGVPGRDDAVEYDKYGISPSFTLGLGEDTRLTFDYYHLTQKGIPDFGIPYDKQTGLPVSEVEGVDIENFYGLVDRDFRESKVDIGSVIFKHRFSNHLRLRNVVRVGSSSNNYVVTNPGHFEDGGAPNQDNGFVYRSTKTRMAETDTYANQFDLTGEFVTGSIRHSFDIGFSVSHEERRLDRYNVDSAAIPAGQGTIDCTSANPNAPALRANGDCASLANPDPFVFWDGTVTPAGKPAFFETDAAAIYAFDTLEFNPHWQVSAGLRLDYYETQMHEPSTGTTLDPDGDYFFNYQLGLVYKPVESGSIYLSHSTATTPAPLAGGNFDNLHGQTFFSGSNVNLDPEETTSYELGTKWALFDQRLRISAAIFQMTRDNANVEVATNTFRTVGETEVRGFELGVSGRITSAWSVFGGYSYLDSELVEGGFSNSGEGKPLPNVAENSFSLATNYRLTSAISLGASAVYRDEVIGGFIFSPPLPPVRRIPDYWRFDANAAWSITDTTTFRVNLKNLTDEEYYDKAYAAHYASVGLGRQLLFSVHIDIE